MTCLLDTDVLPTREVEQELLDILDGKDDKAKCSETVLEIPPVDTPQTAVKLAIAAEVKNNKGHRATGFTLTQMMAVVGLILLLAVITTQFGICPRCCTQEDACIANMRVIEDAKRQWALDHHKSTNDTPVGSDLAPYIGPGTEAELPVCPNDPTQSFDTSYNPQKVGTAPTCKIEPATHVVPRHAWLYDIKRRAEYKVEYRASHSLAHHHRPCLGSCSLVETFTKKASGSKLGHCQALRGFDFFGGMGIMEGNEHGE